MRMGGYCKLKMFLTLKSQNFRTALFDFGEGNGPEPTTLQGDYICDCVHANSPTKYQDHVDNTWDYYTYRTDQVTSGITHPSVAPPGELNQSYAVSVNGINSNCWINSLFENSSPPNFPHSVVNRSFGASYFTQRFWPGVLCNGNYDQTCFTTGPTGDQGLYDLTFSICPQGIDVMRKKIGMYAPNSPTTTFISPKYATFCGHCISSDQQYVTFYNPSTQQFQGVMIDVLPVNTNQYTQSLGSRDMRIGKIATAGVTFPVHHQYYLNPFSLKNYIQLNNKSLNEKLAAFMVNGNGVFVLFYISYSDFNSMNSNEPYWVNEYKLKISGNYMPVIKNVIQPQFANIISGDSGTNFMYSTKSGTAIWPGGAYGGQHANLFWTFRNGRYGIDEVNYILSSDNEPTLTEFVDYENLYKMDDIIDTLPSTSEYGNFIKIKKFIKKITIEKNTINSKKIKIKKESIIEKHYKE